MREQMTGYEMMTEEIPEEKKEEIDGLLNDNRGVGVVEVILILVVIFTIYKGCK